MFKFLVKKSFFDLWDNLLYCFLYNIVFMGTVAVYLFVIKLTQNGPVSVFFVITAVFLFAFCFLIFGFTGVATKWSKYEHSPFFEFFSFGIRKAGHLVLFYILTAFLFFSSIVIIPYYLSLHNYLGIVLAVVLFWICIFLGLTLMYYPALTYKNNIGVFATFKRAMMFFADNKAFSFGTALLGVLVFLVSALSFFMIPGFVGLFLLLADSCKLIDIRYDYAKTKRISRKDIDVRDMFLNEDADVGKRSIRNFFSPWKNND